MNKWVRKSIELAKSENYLDRLLIIYPPDEVSRRKTSDMELQKLKEFFQRGECKNLIRELIKLKKEKNLKFPVEHPYIGFLTHYEDAIDKNPKTVQKICDKLLEMSFNQLKEKLEVPKKPSRRMGTMFKIWLKNEFQENFLFLTDIREFENRKGKCFLYKDDKFLKNYAKEKLGCRFSRLSKGLDFIGKIENTYIIGTAKFITDFGGSQDNQFNEAISFLKETKSSSNVNVIKIAIIDGVPWLMRGKMGKILKSLAKAEFCFSALLLKEFFEKLSHF
ncbi:MAG: hypothetical protein ABDI07_03575 [Candidatus Kryptonium sp.]